MHRTKLIAFTVAAMVALSTPSLSRTPPVFGPSQRLTGVYFTNFENSVFVECRDETACRDWTKLDGAWVQCAAPVCRDLDEQVSRLNGSSQRWGLFAVTIIGRKAMDRRAKRFLNDRETDVLIEEIIDLRLIEGSGSER
ncbi:MAG: hypothetical protein HY859_19170 [Caulobacterales bacterium]|nr:hypothetical protein [Caulobacterales bacterium]